MNRFLILLFFLIVSAGMRAEEQGKLIYQAFDERFVDIVEQLPELKSLGITEIIVSPPQKALID